MKKRVYGILLIAALAAILFLTLQGPDGTVRLSEGLRHWLEQFGVKMTFHSIRSNAHLVLYFILGVTLSLFGRACGWKWWIILGLGCGIGLIDECIKIILPTREFDWIDLVKDWVGISLAILLMKVIERYKRKDVDING